MHIYYHPQPETVSVAGVMWLELCGWIYVAFSQFQLNVCFAIIQNLNWI